MEKGKYSKVVENREKREKNKAVHVQTSTSFQINKRTIFFSSGFSSDSKTKAASKIESEIAYLNFLGFLKQNIFSSSRKKNKYLGILAFRVLKAKVQVSTLVQNIFRRTDNNIET